MLMKLDPLEDWISLLDFFYFLLCFLFHLLSYFLFFFSSPFLFSLSYLNTFRAVLWVTWFTALPGTWVTKGARQTLWTFLFTGYFMFTLCAPSQAKMLTSLICELDDLLTPHIRLILVAFPSAGMIARLEYKRNLHLACHMRMWRFTFPWTCMFCAGHWFRANFMTEGT